MRNLILKRLALGLLTLFFVSILVFVGTEVLPGDVAEAILGQAATPETVAALRASLGLDIPAPQRFYAWLSGVIRGDFGMSLATGVSVADIVATRLPKTLLLAGVAALIAVPIALTLGLFAATRPGTLLDRGITSSALVTISAPEFLIATLLVMLFSVELRWLPAVARIPEGGSLVDYARGLALPVMTLVAMVLAPMTRMTRSSVLGVLSSPPIEMAILKGIPRTRIILRHALPNAIAPIINVVAMNLAYLVSGVVVVEVVFAYPGVAKLMVDAVSSRDIPVVQVCALFFCAVYVLVNLMADVVSIAANPRLRRPR